MKEKSESCVTCGVVFSETIKLHSKNLCRICYYRDYYNKNYISTKPKYDRCLGCDAEKGGTNYKGLEVKTLTKGFCRSCYYTTSKGITYEYCETCNIKFNRKKTNPYCSGCRPRGRFSRRAVDKVKPIKRSELTKEELYTMMLLFRRYKNGTQTSTDVFILVDLFLSVFEGQAHVNRGELDLYDIKDQQVSMLKMLKKVYDNV